MTEREMWWELAKQLEQAVTARPAAKEEWLTGIYPEVEDPEFFFLLANSLGLSKRDNVDDVMRHPHYPGRELRCDLYWCDPPLWERCQHEEDGRCPYFPKPKET
jgi:hypothetical protein